MQEGALHMNTLFTLQFTSSYIVILLLLLALTLFPRGNETALPPACLGLILAVWFTSM